MVEFCDNCGAIIMGNKGEKVECPSCGKSNKSNSDMALSEKVKKKEEVEVVNNDGAAEIHPITEAECSQCGGHKAYHWSKQMRAADEPETQFFKCVDCGHSWRDYG